MLSVQFNLDTPYLTLEPQEQTGDTQADFVKKYGAEFVENWETNTKAEETDANIDHSSRRFSRAPMVSAS